MIINCRHAYTKSKFNMFVSYDDSDDNKHIFCIVR